MMFRKYDKETVDRIGKRLLERDAMPADEIDRIVGDPYLFAKIRARQSAPRPARPLLFVRYSAAVAGILVFVIVTFASFILLRSRQDIAFVPQVQTPADVPAAARPDNLPPLRTGSNPSPGRANFYRDAEPERVTSHAAAYTTPKPKKIIERTDERPEFYPINYTGDAGEITGGSHIVRAEIPRSTLFAMGVNVPLENDSDTVKADLLVGADGVTRAIRVVK